MSTPETCWKCERPVTDTDTPPCEECPMHTASGAIHYLQQACEELYKHVPYRIADDVKEKATAVIDFLNAKEAAPKAELGGKQ